MRKLIEKELHVPAVAMMAVANVLSEHELVASELSRLGRSLFEVMELLGRLMEKDVQVMSIKEGFEL